MTPITYCGRRSLPSTICPQSGLVVVVVVVVVVVSLLRTCQTHKHIQSHIKQLNEIKDLIKNIEYGTIVYQNQIK